MELILIPKTEKSNRNITIPDFLYDDIYEYISKLGGIGQNDRIFYFTKSALEKEIKQAAKKAGLPEIRVHDLRHSHATIFYCFHPFYLVSSLFFLIYKLFLSRLRFIFLMK